MKIILQALAIAGITACSLSAMEKAIPQSLMSAIQSRQATVVEDILKAEKRLLKEQPNNTKILLEACLGVEINFFNDAQSQSLAKTCAAIVANRPDGQAIARELLYNAANDQHKSRVYLLLLAGIKNPAAQAKAEEKRDEITDIAESEHAYDIVRLFRESQP